MVNAALEDWLVLDAAAPSIEEPLLTFLDGTARGELVLPFCTNGHPLDFDQGRCEQDGSTEQPVWRTVSSRATVIASIVMHRTEKTFVKAVVPYPVIEVELGSGHRLYVSTDREPERNYQAGDQVELTFVVVGETRIPRIQVEEPKNKRSGQ
ncbi:OB-fold domain-containing protein [Arthrobacter sp. MMS18-M83]|uniref:OB-fold domain-containing protein n=1 Tax=Arthrobacter sp. MMS18-M83 TaxID=2996261 RepID=UPI00227D3BDF|nr:OB-fold domain-containing protein [Arthrobacter sp. MMS18-M83]WAH97649.1 OB-fold domain-containing protein [Arthrobacter sp. MMS18-M83]